MRGVDFPRKPFRMLKERGIVLLRSTPQEAVEEFRRIISGE